MTHSDRSSGCECTAERLLSETKTEGNFLITDFFWVAAASRSYEINAGNQIIIIIIITLVIAFMHGIYNNIPDTKRFSRAYSVAAVLY